jgi:hypothetical protein
MAHLIPQQLPRLHTGGTTEACLKLRGSVGLPARAPMKLMESELMTIRNGTALHAQHRKRRDAAARGEDVDYGPRSRVAQVWMALRDHLMKLYDEHIIARVADWTDIDHIKADDPPGGDEATRIIHVWNRLDRDRPKGAENGFDFSPPWGTAEDVKEVLEGLKFQYEWEKRTERGER